MFPVKPKKIQNIYLDHAAATPLEKQVFESMKPYFSSDFANPSALYSLGVKAKKKVEEARKKVAEIVFTQPDTIYFTSGGTEANNVALFGVIEELRMKNYELRKKFHIITTKIEHDSVLRPIQELEKQGVDVTYLDGDETGLVSVEELKKALRKETVLVSVMYANNEIGTIEPIAEIGREILKWRKSNKTSFPYFHTDACQAANYLELSVEKLHVDFLTLNGSKIYGPKGVGVLYKRRGVALSPQSFGGRQEKGLRAGTENVPGIIGFAKALELVQKKKEKENVRMEKLRNYFWDSLQKNIPDVFVNGPHINFSPYKGGACLPAGRLEGVERRNKLRDIKDPTQPPLIGEGTLRLPSNLNVYFKDVEAEALILYLDSYGIACSSGSACSTESNEPSHVLKACGMSDERSFGSIRFSLGKDTTKKDIDRVMKYLPGIVEELRKTTKVQ